MVRWSVILNLLLACLPGCGDGQEDTKDASAPLEITSEIDPQTTIAAQTDPYRQVFDDMLEVWEQMRDILAEVHDLPSAEEAAPKMRAAFDRGYEVLVRAAQLAPPPPEKEKALLDEYMPLRQTP